MLSRAALESVQSRLKKPVEKSLALTGYTFVAGMQTGAGHLQGDAMGSSLFSHAAPCPHGTLPLPTEALAALQRW